MIVLALDTALAACSVGLFDTERDKVLASESALLHRGHAEALLPDGVTFVRDAAVRPSIDPRRPFIALLWQQGTRAPAPEQASDATAPGKTPDGNSKL